MKKSYISPECLIIETTPSQMIAASLKVGGKVEKAEDVGFVKGDDASGEDEGFWEGNTEW